MRITHSAPATTSRSRRTRPRSCAAVSWSTQKPARPGTTSWTKVPITSAYSCGSDSARASARVPSGASLDISTASATISENVAAAETRAFAVAQNSSSRRISAAEISVALSGKKR